MYGEKRMQKIGSAFSLFHFELQLSKAYRRDTRDSYQLSKVYHRDTRY